MPLRPEIEAFVRASEAARAPDDVYEGGPAAETYLRLARASVAREDCDESEQVRSVASAQLPSGRPVRIYTPDAGTDQPVLLFFHGGGWVLGNLDMQDEVCRRLANRAGCTVVSVDYRLAPEASFPAPLDDCYEALEWVAHEAASFGGDPGRIGVAGMSAGGNLAAALALRARAEHGPPLALQVLIYPVLDSGMDTPSYREFATGVMLEAKQMRWYWDQYVPEPTDRVNPYASPAHADDLSGLPPALVVTPEFDPLRDEGEAYAARLSAAGVRAQSVRYDGQIHSFVRLLRVTPDADRAVTQVARFVRDEFAAEATGGIGAR